MIVKPFLLNNPSISFKDGSRCARGRFIIEWSKRKGKRHAPYLFGQEIMRSPSCFKISLIWSTTFVLSTYSNNPIETTASKDSGLKGNTSASPRTK